MVVPQPLWTWAFLPALLLAPHVQGGPWCLVWDLLNPCPWYDQQVKAGVRSRVSPAQHWAAWEETGSKSRWEADGGHRGDPESQDFW